jgi:hypothetical protein
MKSTSLIATALAAVLAASASIASANAGENKAAVAHRAQLTDVSAARRHYARHHYSHHAYAPSTGYGERGPGWYGADVNAGSRPDSLLSFYRRNHICAIDEGYGRVTRCD